MKHPVSIRDQILEERRQKFAALDAMKDREDAYNIEVAHNRVLELRVTECRKHIGALETDLRKRNTWCDEWRAKLAEKTTFAQWLEQENANIRICNTKMREQLDVERARVQKLAELLRGGAFLGKLDTSTWPFKLDGEPI